MHERDKFLKSLLMPGPKSPGKKIDVYLLALIEELKELWNFRVCTYDSLIGWSSKRYQACSICLGDVRHSGYEVIELRETENLSHDFFSLAMGPSLDVRSYNGSITDGVHQVFYLYNPKNGSNWKGDQVVQDKCIWDIPEVDNVENEQLNVLEIVVGTMSSFSSGFEEIDVMFLEFVEDINNNARESLSVGDNSVHTNGRISMSIAHGTEKYISPHTVQFNHAIEVVKGDYRFVEHQMLSTFKEFRDDCHMHFKKYTATLRKHAHIGGTYGRLVLCLRSLHESCIPGRSHFYNDSMNSLSNENQMLELQSHPISEGFQPLSEMRYMKLLWVDD
ncbi:CACTA en-spm transposon protein [Cucumis melo var. makuwa]|uniref:CACTA en-spm transposon protein n=1 Tax=Cucumis melo var. makuwa TaxID=1194695 RepID=A0A5D3BZD7_CUCMM|nr:CACTA en-spm transposon protein [Cucumis melo var. makuwa]TYK04378.1 CACTA en-spm transposon protein [Cucumis melo var. makuwa]